MPMKTTAWSPTEDVSQIESLGEIPSESQAVSQIESQAEIPSEIQAASQIESHAENPNESRAASQIESQDEILKQTWGSDDRSLAAGFPGATSLALSALVCLLPVPHASSPANLGRGTRVSHLA